MVIFHSYVTLPEGNVFFSCCIIMCYWCSRGAQKVVFLKVMLMLYDILLIYTYIYIYIDIDVDTVSLFIYLTALPSSSTASKRSRDAKKYTEVDGSAAAAWRQMVKEFPRKTMVSNRQPGIWMDIGWVFVLQWVDAFVFSLASLILMPGLDGESP